MAISKIETQALDIGQVGGRRNLIINGAMQVAQRGTSKTGVTSGTYATVDRFQNGVNALGTWTEEQSTDAPSGFSNSFKLTCTTADASPAAGDYSRILYTFEGQDLQQFAFGTSDAKNMTISFWIKSNKTGTLSTILRNTDSNRIAGELVSINAANTWEYKTVTLNGDTTSGFTNDNQTSAQLQWWFNAGSTYSGGSLSNSFETLSGNKYYSNGTLGLGGAVNDYVAITGVQLEVGSVATPFEHRSYGEELAACMRYFESSNETGELSYMPMAGYQSNELYGTYLYKVKKRTTPTISFNSTNWNIYSAGAQRTFTSANVDGSGISNLALRIVGSGWTTGHAVFAKNPDANAIQIDAEL